MELETFARRLKRAGVEIQLMGNIPWIYLVSVNGHPVKEKFMSEYGYTVAFLPPTIGTSIRFTDLKRTFELIRKYRDL